MKEQQITSIIYKHLQGNALEQEEQHIMDAWLQSTEANRQVFKELQQEGELGQYLAVMLNEQRINGSYELFRNRSKKAERPRRAGNIILLRRWGVAAILILAIGSGIYYFNTQSYKSEQSHKSQFRQETQAYIQPGSNKAILTINNQQNIDLATNKTGININNIITYSDGEKIADAGQILKLTTPRGGQYQAVLPDGSKVWLNAASSITFPSKFSNTERRVEVTGEAYFEIAKDAAKPFKVSGGGQEIEVLGTSFNINIYDDEPTKKTTLITGSIKITNNNQTAILQPGQQANISILEIPKIRLIPVQTTDVIAWKNGYFQFHNTDLATILRQLSRWYDIEIAYEKGIPSIQLDGEMKRDLNLLQVLEVLGEMGMKYRMEGRRITVAP